MQNLLSRMQSWCRRAMSAHLARRPFRLKCDRAIVSFTFDDFPRSALTEGGRILNQYGAKGTFYVSLGLMDQQIPAGEGFSADDLRTAVADGHEMGCHTYAHCHSWETPPRVFEDSILENQRRVREIAAGVTFATLSYPIHCPRPGTKRRAARHFAACRGGGQTFNFGEVDLNSLSAYFLEKSRDNMGAVRAMIDETCRVGGWLILATHDVAENPSPFGCTPAFFEQVVEHAAKSEAQICPVAKALELQEIQVQAPQSV